MEELSVLRNATFSPQLPSFIIDLIQCPPQGVLQVQRVLWKVSESSVFIC